MVTRRRRIIGVMGPGAGASAADEEVAFALGAAIANRGWTTLCGGRAAGVMDAVCRGAKSRGGLTLGILPDGGDGPDVSPYLDIVVRTGMGNARNAINVLSSDRIVAIGMGPGTASEIALALKLGKPVVLLNLTVAGAAFWKEVASGRVHTPADVEEAIALLASFEQGDPRP